MKNEIAIRELKYSDIDQMWKLCRKLKNSFHDVGRMNIDEFTKVWHHRWRRNNENNRNIPLGWCIEHHREGIVSFIGRVAMDWWIDGKEHQCWGTSSWISDPRYIVHSSGNGSLKMHADASDMIDVPVVLRTSVAPSTAVVLEYLGFNKVPDGVSLDILDWIINGSTFFRSWLTYKNNTKSKSKSKNIQTRITGFLVKSKMIYPVSYLYGIYQYFNRFIHFRDTVDESYYHISIVDKFNTDFLTLWNDNKKKVFSTAVRTPDILNWRHIDHPELKGTTYVLRCDIDGTLKGYIALRFLSERESFCKHVVITDLFYDFDNMDIAKALIIAAYRFSKKKGADRFKVSGLHRELMEWLKTQHPIIRENNRCTYWYKYNGSFSEKMLGKWHASGIDGDLYL